MNMKKMNKAVLPAVGLSMAAGAALLGLVLRVPALEPLFRVAALSVGQLGAVAGLAFGSMAVIQLLKAVRR